MLVYTHKKSLRPSTLSNSSMPNLIEMIQYITSWKSDPTIRVGNLGTYSNYSYVITFDPRIVTNDPTCNITQLSKILKNKNMVNIAKPDIFDMFYVYEIPDYSANALTTGMVDFMVECFSQNGKINNNYIAIMKSFTTKRAYILIDKSQVTIPTDNQEITIYVEPATVSNPLVSDASTTDGKKKILKQSTLTCTRLTDNKFCFVINDDNNGQDRVNSSSKYLSNYLDYDLYYSATADIQSTASSLSDYYRISETAYNMKAESVLEFLGSYTNFQTYNGSEIPVYTRNTDSSMTDTMDYRGDYFKQVQMTLMKKLQSETYSSATLTENLLKFIPYLEDKPNSTIITIELSSNYLNSTKSRIKSTNLYLISRQAFARYTYSRAQKNQDVWTVTLPDGIFGADDVEIYRYPYNSEIKNWNYASGIHLHSGVDFSLVYSTDNTVDELRKPATGIKLKDTNDDQCI